MKSMHHNINRLLLLTALGVAITITTLQAQNSRVDTFYITAAVKTEAHPYYGMGHERGYVVNGVEGDTIYLVRDSTYVFNMSALPQDLPMTFYTVPIGGGSGFYEDFVIKRHISAGIAIVKPTDETPDILYYACFEEPWVGGTIVVVDSLTSSIQDEDRIAGATIGSGRSSAVPNPFTESTTLHFSLAAPSSVQVELYDAYGRRLYEREEGMMRSGPGEVRISGTDLPGGVYHYRIIASASGERQVMSGSIHVLK